MLFRFRYGGVARRRRRRSVAWRGAPNQPWQFRPLHGPTEAGRGRLTNGGMGSGLPDQANQVAVHHYASGPNHPVQHPESACDVLARRLHPRTRATAVSRLLRLTMPASFSRFANAPLTHALSVIGECSGAVSAQEVRDVWKTREPSGGSCRSADRSGTAWIEEPIRSGPASRIVAWMAKTTGAQDLGPNACRRRLKTGQVRRLKSEHL